jgi:hypothetical protein
MKTVYEIQIKSLCPPQAYLRLEVHDQNEAADLTHRFLRNGSSDDFEKGVRVLHMPFEDAIGCGQYELGTMRPLEILSEGDFPIMNREDIEALEASVEQMEPVVSQDDDGTLGEDQCETSELSPEPLV